MTKRSLFRKLTFLVSVPKCVCCGEKLNIRELTFCDGCKRIFSEEINRDCSICMKRLSECSCASEYLSNHFVKKLFKVFRYKNDNEVSSSLIYSLKKQSRYDTVDFAAELLYQSINKCGGVEIDTIITNVPRRLSAILKFGHDHSARVAKKLAKKLNVKYKSLLKSKAKLEQKHLNEKERLKNINVSPKRKFDLTGKSVLIVDDVVTSGASMAACSSMIRSLGCKKIYGAVLAIAYRDSI